MPPIAATRQSCHDVHDIPFAHRPHQVGAAEADAVEHVHPFAQRHLGVATVRRTYPGHGQPRDAQQRRLIPDAVEGHQLGEEYVIHGSCARHKVEHQCPAGIAHRRRVPEARKHRGSEVVIPGRIEMAAGCRSMTAVSFEQRRVGSERGTQVEAAGAARGTSPGGDRGREHDRRSSQLVREAAGDEPNHAGSPGAGHDGDGRPVIGSRASRGPRPGRWS